MENQESRKYKLLSKVEKKSFANEYAKDNGKRLRIIFWVFMCVNSFFGINTITLIASLLKHKKINIPYYIITLTIWLIFFLIIIIVIVKYTKKFFQWLKTERGIIK